MYPKKHYSDVEYIYSVQQTITHTGQLMLIYHNFLQSSPFVPASSSHLVSFLAECCTVTGQPTYLLASDENESPCDTAVKGKEDCTVREKMLLMSVTKIRKNVLRKLHLDLRFTFP